VGGFDIAPTSTATEEAYALLAVGFVWRLYTINLATGAATAVGLLAPDQIGSFAAFGHMAVRLEVLNFAADLTVPESGAATITVTRPPHGTGQTVSYEVLSLPGDTATAGVDYIGEPGVLTFLPGQTSASFVVPIQADGLVEGNETFSVRLVAPGGIGQFGAITPGVSAPGVLRVTIVDAGLPPTPTPTPPSPRHSPMLFRDMTSGW
jgi:hypothetical protein